MFILIDFGSKYIWSKNFIFSSFLRLCWRWLFLKISAPRNRLTKCFCGNIIYNMLEFSRNPILYWPLEFRAMFIWSCKNPTFPKWAYFLELFQFNHRAYALELQTGGKPSTWLPPAGFEEQLVLLGIEKYAFLCE